MIKIEKVQFNTRNAEAGALCSKMSEAIDQSGLSDPFLMDLNKQIKTANQNLVSGINKDKAESDLEEQDERRDATYRSILYLTKGYVHHPDKQVSQAANAVEEVIDKYGFELTNATYAAQSTLLDSFVEDMNRPEVLSSVEKLKGFKSLSEQLSTDISNFKLAERELLNARKQEQKSSNATAAKKEVLQLVNTKLVVYLRAMVQVNAPVYQDLVAELMLLISTSNRLVKSRRTREN